MSNMNKHAYLVIAHNQMELLKTLIECLDYQYNDIYIHLDKKWKNVDVNQILGICKKAEIHILKKDLTLDGEHFLK